MTNYQSPKMTFDAMFKLALLALLTYMAYLLSGYVENGRYQLQFSESPYFEFEITDTRTGETVFYRDIHKNNWQRAIDHQGVLQKVRFIVPEADEEKPVE